MSAELDSARGRPYPPRFEFLQYTASILDESHGEADNH